MLLALCRVLFCRFQYTDDEKCGALALLYALLTTQELKIEAIDGELVEGATGLLADVRSSPQTRSNAAYVLASLALIMRGRDRLAAAESIGVIADACLDDSPDVALAAAAAMANVAKFRDGWATVVGVTKAVPSLVKAMPRNPAVVGAMVPLTGLFFEGTDVVLRAGAMSRLVKLLREATTSLDKKSGLQALRNLVNNDEGKEKAIQHGGVEAVAKLLGDADRDVRQLASGTILTLCIVLEAKQLFMDCGMEAVDAMCALLRDDAEHVRTNATAAIQCLLELPVAKAAFCRALVHDLDLIKSVFGSSASGPLCELLAVRNADVRASATYSLAAFTSSDEGAADVVNALHIVPRLAGVLADKSLDFKAQKAAAEALRVLCTRYEDSRKAFARLATTGETAAGIRPQLVSFPALSGFVVAR